MAKKFNPHEYAIEAAKMSNRMVMQQFELMVRSFTYLEYRHELGNGIEAIHFRLDILKREIIDRMSYVPPSPY